jgi:hypothetical protein
LEWHDLKTELDDAICRASYLCKLDQKDLLPDEFKRGNSFGHTRPPEVALRTMNDLKTFQSVHNWDYYNHLIHHLRLMAFLTIRLGQPSQNNKIAVIASYAIL